MIIKIKKNIISRSNLESVLFLILPFLQLYDFEFFKIILLTEDLTSRRIGFPVLCFSFIPLFVLTLRKKVKHRKLEIFFILYILKC